MNLTADEKERMLQELLNAIEPPDTRDQFPQPNITTAEYAARLGLRKDTAYRKLRSAVEKKRIKKSDEKVYINGSWCWLYWK